MAENVFGVPVTTETVRKYFPSKPVITRKDRAYLAYNLKEADEKNEKAEEYVLKLKESYGDGIATLITIYNATGDTLTLLKDHDYLGEIHAPGYPSEIHNGQWAAFLHVAGSSAAVAYSGLNYDESGGEEYAWLNAWYNVPNDTKKYVYTEIRKPDHYVNDDNVWASVKKLINNEAHNDIHGGCHSTASMTQDNPYQYSGIMTLECIP